MSSVAGMSATRAARSCKVQRAAVYQYRRLHRAAAHQVALQILEYVGKPTTTRAIVPARSLLLEMNGHQLAAPEEVFEVISALGFDQLANPKAEAGHDH